MNARACFVCGECGHLARNCPKQDGKAKALETSDGIPKKTFIGCFGCDDFIPVHRMNNKKVTPMARARDFEKVLQRAPRGCTMGECIGDAFARLAALESVDAVAEETEDSEEVAIRSSLAAKPTLRTLSWRRSLLLLVRWELTRVLVLLRHPELWRHWTPHRRVAWRNPV